MPLPAEAEAQASAVQARPVLQAWPGFVAPEPRSPAPGARVHCPPMAGSRNPDAAPVPSVDQSSLHHLLGYHMAQADIPAKAAYYKYIGDPLQLRHVEFTILMLVKANPGVTQKQLSQTLAVSAPNITLLLDRLEDKGWIERVRSDADRRVQHVQLTAAGVALARQSHELSLDCEREMLRHLTPGERLLLLELLDKVARHRRV